MRLKMQQTATQVLRHKIIKAALPDILFDGWSLDTCVQAAAKQDISATDINAAFPCGITDILDAFSDLADHEMLNALNDQDPNTLRIRDRIRTALIARFIYLNDHKEAVKDSLKFWLNPLRKPRLAKIVWRTADQIWNWAGDNSADYNHYTKRAMLSGIITSSTLVWLKDHSEDMNKTIAFIDARIDNVMSIEKIKSKIKAA